MLSEILRIKGVVDIAQGDARDGVLELAAASFLDGNNRNLGNNSSLLQRVQPAHFNNSPAPKYEQESILREGPGPLEIMQEAARGAATSIQEAAGGVVDKFVQYNASRELERKQRELQQQAELLIRAEWDGLRLEIREKYFSAIEHMQLKAYKLSAIYFTDVINSYTKYVQYLEVNEKTTLTQAKIMLGLVQHEIQVENNRRQQLLALPDNIARKIVNAVTLNKQISEYEFDQACDIISRVLNDNLDVLNLNDNTKIENSFTQIVNKHILTRYKISTIFGCQQPFYLPSDTRLEVSLRESLVSMSQRTTIQLS